jgi:uncharacterized membrane protein/Mg-chelatase subunit ChlD
MFNYQIRFESPWYLALLALLPVLWWFSLRRLVLLGRVRRLLVIGLRTVVLTTIILALAGIQMVRISDRLTVIYLLDQSLSIPAEQRRAMIEYVNAEIVKHRQGDEDRVGAIIFGRDAAIEIPPFNDDVQLDPLMEAALDREYTNLAGALKLAYATFPEDSAKRIVVVSDGNQNLGNAIEQAQGVAGAGIGIDVVPVHYRSRAEVVVEGLAIPGNVRRNEPFDLTVVINNTAPAAIRGKLKISRLADGEPEVLNKRPEDQVVTLPPGKKVFSFREEITASNFYTYKAEFFPDQPGEDAPQNNVATAFTYVRGAGRVLLIEDYKHPGEFDQLVAQLREDGLEVTVQPTNQLFTSPGELLPYDTVLLANVPRATDEDVAFSDAQIQMLVSNTQQMGAGLMMLGGPNSFGAGGWTNTALEKAMPVDFQIKSAEVVPKGALVMMMHACEIPQGNHWQKVIAHEAVKALGVQDYCGLLYWGPGGDQWLWGNGLSPVGNSRDRMMGRIDRMTPGDMPGFDPAMKMAIGGFRGVPDAAIKHMIIISDGDPAPPSAGVVQALRNMGVTISTVAVGAHGPAGSTLLLNLATQMQGKYYAPRSPQALPRIFQREARRVARRLVYEKDTPWHVQVNSHTEILGQIDALPPITGFVLTTRKDNPLVEVSLVSPQPVGDRNNTILASWTYGLGRAVVFTSDAGARWTKQWPGTQVYGTLFSKMVRWSMRPTGGSGKFTVASEVSDEQVRVVVTALDKDDQFLNFLNMSGEALGPELKRIPFKLEQAAPGRYVGAFPARGAGSYYVAVSPGMKGTPPIFSGVNVPYSDEFRDRETNEALLGELAGMTPKGSGGKAGKVIDAPQDAKNRLQALLAFDTFRHGELPKATSSQDAWFYLVLLGSCLFFFDVFFRRVQVSLAWVGPWVAQLVGRRPPPAKVETIERLRSRKAEVAGRIEQLRSEARFEPAPEITATIEDLEPATAPKPSLPAAPSVTAQEAPEVESYTERLLRAKRKVWDDQGKDK